MEPSLSLAARVRVLRVEDRFKVDWVTFDDEIAPLIRRKIMTTYVKGLIHDIHHIPSVCYSALAPDYLADMRKVMRMIGYPAVTGRCTVGAMNVESIAALLEPAYAEVEKWIARHIKDAKIELVYKYADLRQTVILEEGQRRLARAEARQADNVEAQVRHYVKKFSARDIIEGGETPALEDYPDDAPFHGFTAESEWGRLQAEGFCHLAACQEMLDLNCGTLLPKNLELARIHLEQARECQRQAELQPSPGKAEAAAVTRILEQLGSPDVWAMRLKALVAQLPPQETKPKVKLAKPARPVRAANWLKPAAAPGKAPDHAAAGTAAKADLSPSGHGKPGELKEIQPGHSASAQAGVAGPKAQTVMVSDGSPADAPDPKLLAAQVAAGPAAPPAASSRCEQEGLLSAANPASPSAGVPPPKPSGDEVYREAMRQMLRQRHPGISETQIEATVAKLNPPEQGPAKTPDQFRTSGGGRTQTTITKGAFG